MSMNVSLTPQLENYIKQKVATGMYNSVRDSLQAMKLEALKADIQQGLDSLERGEGKPLDMEQIKARGRQLLNKRNGD